MKTTFTRTRMTWLAYILLALYAYFLNILGPITPFLHDEFQISYTVSSLHFSAFAVGILAVGVAGQPVIRRLGRVRSLAAGALGLGLGALLLVLGRAAPVTIGAAFLMGCVGSLILAVVPPVLSETHGELRAVAISEANVLSSLLATGAPLLVGWLARLVIGWRPALILGALLAIFIGLVLLRFDGSRKALTRVATAEHRLPWLFWFYWLVLVLAVSVEFCMIFWSADFLESTFGLSSAGAAQAVSLFLAGMILGRMASGQLVRRFATRGVVLASLLLGALGFMVYWSAVNSVLAMAGLAITGLGVAGLYPLILSMAIGASGGSEAQAGARTTLASGVAILALPLVLGRLADLAGLKTAFGVVAVLFASMFFLMILAPKMTSPARASQPETQP